MKKEVTIRSFHPIPSMNKITPYSNSSSKNKIHHAKQYETSIEKQNVKKTRIEYKNKTTNNHFYEAIRNNQYYNNSKEEYKINKKNQLPPIPTYYNLHPNKSKTHSKKKTEKNVHTTQKDYFHMKKEDLIKEIKKIKKKDIILFLSSITKPKEGGSIQRNYIEYKENKKNKNENHYVMNNNNIYNNV